MSEAVRASGGLKMSPGKMVYDITPTDGIDKGTAATGLFRRYGGLPLYFGDDTTDESVFAALPSASNHGVCRTRWRNFASPLPGR